MFERKPCVASSIGTAGRIGVRCHAGGEGRVESGMNVPTLLREGAPGEHGGEYVRARNAGRMTSQ